MKWKILCVGMCLVGFQASAQLKQYNEERLNMDRGLMLALGSWGTANFSSGAIGWATTPKGEAHYFHQMNFFWNTVNLGLAIPGYLKARKGETDLSLAKTLQQQRKTETIFLVNAGLDIAYMSAGLLLKSEARFNVERRDQWRGYGNSLLMQGGFLFLFDLTAYVLHRRHFKKKLDPKLEQIQLSQNGFGLQWNIPVHRTPTFQTSFL